MITAFARSFGSTPLPPLAQSAYFDDGGGLNQGESYLSGAFDYGLQLPQGEGFTFSTWVKPDWQTGPGGTPVYFIRYQTNGDNVDTLFLGYDSETTYDSIFVRGLIWDGPNILDIFFYAPVAADPQNQAITGLSYATYNSWNPSTNTDFVNITATFTDQFSPAQNPGDLSNNCTIFWNGQPLNTYETWSGSSNTGFALTGFRVWASQIDIGNTTGWARKHWQDRTSLRLQYVNPGTVLNDYYNNGSPLDPVPGTELHFNYENPLPYDSNGTLNYTLVGVNSSPAQLPVFDPTQGVA